MISIACRKAGAAGSEKNGAVCRGLVWNAKGMMPDFKLSPEASST
jgi:hypothetical protein